MPIRMCTIFHQQYSYNERLQLDFLTTTIWHLWNNAITWDSNTIKLLHHPMSYPPPPVHHYPLDCMIHHILVHCKNSESVINSPVSYSHHHHHQHIKCCYTWWWWWLLWQWGWNFVFKIWFITCLSIFGDNLEKFHPLTAPK